MYFTDTLSFNGQIFEVHGPTADGGFAWFLRPSYDTSTTHFHVRWGHFAPGILRDFNVMGFLQDDNRKEFDTNFGHTFFFEMGLFERVRPSVNFNRSTSFDQGVLRRYSLAPTVDAQLRNGLEFEVNYRNEYRLHRTRGVLQPADNLHGRLEQPRRALDLLRMSAPGVNFDNDLSALWRRSALGLRRQLRLVLQFDAARAGARSTRTKARRSTSSRRPMPSTRTFIVRAFFQSNSVIGKENIQVLGVWRFNPPFGQLQVAYQKGTSAFGTQSDQGHTFFTKLAWVL